MMDPLGGLDPFAISLLFCDTPLNPPPSLTSHTARQAFNLLQAPLASLLYYPGPIAIGFNITRRVVSLVKHTTPLPPVSGRANFLDSTSSWLLIVTSATAILNYLLASFPLPLTPLYSRTKFHLFLQSSFYPPHTSRNHRGLIIGPPPFISRLTTIIRN